MTDPLEIPCDGRRTGPPGEPSTWLTESAPLPPGPCADVAGFVAAVAAVLARLTGAATITCGLARHGGTLPVRLTLAHDTTLAQLRSSAQESIRTGTPAQQGTQVLLGEGPAPEPAPGAEWRVGIDGERGVVELAAPASLYRRDTVARTVEAIARALPGAEPEGAVADLDLLSREESRLLVEELNDTAAAIPEGDVYSLLAQRAAEVENQPALVWSGGSMTYRELHDAVAVLAEDLVAAGVGHGGYLHVLLPRGPELVVSWLAALRLGAVCVPIDPEYPEERIAQVSRTTQPSAVLIRADAADREGTPVHRVDIDDLRRHVAPPTTGTGTGQHDLAYVVHTSGSTGTPKGVAIEQRSLLNLLHHTAEEFGLRPGRRSLQVASPSFDVSVWEILAPLYAGATVVTLDHAVWSASTLREFVRTHRIDTVFLLSSTLVRLEPGEFPDVRTVITGGESFGRPLVDRWQPGRDLIYVYGPTEATVFQSWHRCYADAQEEAASVGRPMPNLRYHLLDAWNRPAATGVVGQLHIGGIGVGRGYVGDPVGTEQKFVPDPFGGPGDRLYRSGDLASFRPNGVLDFRGRVDTQVKVRGHRIELGEVETALAGIEGVRATAVVAAHGSDSQERVLVAYATGEHPLDTRRLSAALAERLPYYMVPAHVVELDELPYTPNGKIDRRELAARGVPAHNREDAEQAVPGAPVHAITRAIAELLERPEVSPTDGFFALGGHSLAAAELAVRLRAEFGVDLRVRDVFECSTALALAERVADRRSARSDEVEPEPGAAGDLLPAQRWLWLEHQRRADTDARYNVPVLLDWEGPIDGELLASALNHVQDRHELLRARLTEERGGIRLHWDAPEATWEVVDTTADDLPDDVAQRSNRPFDLATGPLLRMTLFRLPDGTHRVLLVAHHIVCDGQSLEVVIDDLLTTWNALRHGRPEPDSAPVTHAEACATVPGAESMDGEFRYWQAKLSPPPPPAMLPVDHVATTSPGTRTDAIAVPLDFAATAALDAVAAQEHASKFISLCGLTSLVLHQLTGDDETFIGTPVDLRAPFGLGGYVGCLVNTIVLRIPNSPRLSFRQLLRDTAKEVIDAVDNGAYPFDRLVERLAPPIAAGRNPYFDTWITLYDEIDVRADDVRVRGGPVPLRTGLTDLSFQFRSGGDGLRLTLQYDADRYEEATATSVLDRLRDLLVAVAAEPDTPIAELDARRAPKTPGVDLSFSGFDFDSAENSWHATATNQPNPRRGEPT